ncbi:hypothetical protein [Lysobacter fragariae]
MRSTIRTSLAAATLFALPLQAAPAAQAIRWPNPWAATPDLTYQSEGLETQVKNGVREQTRHTDTTTLHVTADKGEGFVQEWTVNGSKWEIIEGDPAKAATLEAAGKVLQGFPIATRLDRDGNYVGIDNITELATRMRDSLRPLIVSGVERKLAAIPDATARESARSEAMQRVDDALAQLTTPAVVEVTVGRVIQTYNAFVGVELEPEQWYEVETALDNPLGGDKLPAKLQFTLYPSKDDADDIFLEWNSSIDPAKGAQVAWDIAGKLAGVPISQAQRKGLPGQVVIHDTGFALFRRATGVTEMFETTRTVKLGGQEKTKRERMRLANGNHAHEWTQEDAPAAAMPAP